MANDDTADEKPPVVVPDKPYGFPREAFDPSLLPDVDTDFIAREDVEAFIAALSAPDPNHAHNSEDVSTLRLASPLVSPSAHFLGAFDGNITRRQSSSVAADGRPPAPRKDEQDEAQEVAVHAAAATADVSVSSAARSASQSNGNAAAPLERRGSLFITAQNDWAPVHQKIGRGGSGGGSGGGKAASRRKNKRPRAVRQGLRTKDETREGYLYGLLKWPFLVIVGCWLMGLSVAYVLTRYYIWFYEYFISWRGRRERLRRNMRATANYRDWRAAARELDEFLGNSAWKEKNEFAYYDWKTVKRVWDSMKKSRESAVAVERKIAEGQIVEDEERQKGEKAVEALRALLAASVKNNFVGVENPRLYSQTYYGTKNLVQNHADEGKCTAVLLRASTTLLTVEQWRRVSSSSWRRSR